MRKSNDDFRTKVFQIVRQIPSGRTLSYKEVAKRAGKPAAWRAVGNILHQNNDPEIPCHRVIRSDGKIGGYNRGIAKKYQLLASEYFLRFRRGKRLRRSFYTRNTLVVAKDLLGKYIVRKIGNKEIVGRIIETEAYIGPRDKASHAWRGRRTPRNEAEYLAGGHIYIYLVYGMHWQCNITTAKKNMPECVLIRALEPIFVPKTRDQNADMGIKQRSSALSQIANGPGKLCRYLKLDKSFYGEDVTKSKRIWIEDRGDKISSTQIKRSPRIGIDYAGPYWSSRKWRFYLENENGTIKQ